MLHEGANEPDIIFDSRFESRFDELKWLYHELYHGDDKGFDYLCNLIKAYYIDRSDALKALDRRRE